MPTAKIRPQRNWRPWTLTSVSLQDDLSTQKRRTNDGDTPAGGAGDVGSSPVDTVGKDDARDNHELVDRNEAATVLLGHDFTEVKGHKTGPAEPDEFRANRQHFCLG